MTEEKQIVTYYSTKDVVEEYNKRRFSTDGGKAVDKLEKNIVLQFTSDNSQSFFLDIGTGTGRFAQLFAGKNFVGIDSSESMLRRAKQFCEVICCDASHLPFKNSVFTNVISIRFFIRIKELGKYFNEIARVMNKRGIFIFDTANKYNISTITSFFTIEPPQVRHSRNTIQRTLTSNGLLIEEEKPLFLIPRGFHQISGGIIHKIFWNFDQLLIRIGLSKISTTSFWKARKESS